MSAGIRERLALVVSVAGAMLVALDGTVLLVAQPGLRRDLGASVAQVQWTSTGYLVAVASLLVIAGRLGDRYGHRRLLLAGVAGFGLASGGIALAPGIGWVIGLRVAQGVFGALLQPATLALLRLAYPADRLGTAVAVRTGAIGVAAAAGPVLGGVLVAQWGWRAVFWVNVPVALLLVLLVLAVRVPTAAPAGDGRLDLVGAGLLALALGVLVGALSGVPERGWTSGPTVCGLAAASGLAGALVVQERRSAQPIVPPAVARSRSVTASMAMLLLISGGMSGALFAATFLLQDVLGLEPLASALRVLPLTVLMVLGAPVAGAALRRYGPRRVAVPGVALVVLGLTGLSRLGPHSAWPVTGAAFAVLGAGFATVMVTATGTVVGDAPPGYAGVVGGLKQTAVNVGPAFGIAVAASTMLLKSAAGGAGSASDGSAAATGGALLALAGIAALALLPAGLLPGRPAPATAGG
ncbi:MFS transporter [Streptomyces sp. CT34]|uniref:MFS transporter n=1 Tax=Streptomyces sp. CT34 TaxID=1553907 RepID=UPI0005BBFB4C|nr:MFS transporter [Streptomyces sp. CT34]